MTLLVSLILAHLLGDFLFQPKSWVRAKEEKKAKSWQLYVHVLVHGALTFVLLMDLQYWDLVIILMASHLIIDFTKLEFQKPKTQTTWFLVDQALHLAVILFFGLYWQNQENLILYFFSSNNFLLIVTSLFFLTLPTVIGLNVLLHPWSETIGNESSQTLKNAGKYIGILERLLVFVFIMTNHFEAIGFLLAAKSVFRFGDLKESRERKLTEYILIGTLLSFGIAIVVGLLTRSLIVSW